MIRIITDSAADFEPWELERYGITCIPLSVIFEAGEYRENIDLSKAQFYKMLACGEFPKTAQPSPKTVLDVFESAKQAGDEAIYICLSSALSGTYQTAVAMLEEADFADGYVFDSRNATAGQRLLVEQAVKLRGEGKSAKEILAELEILRDRVVLYACVDTLEYLYRGGRISKTSYTVGSIAQIKPIISVDLLGAIAVPAKAMGMRKGMDFLCKRVEAQKPSKEHSFYAMYTGDRSNGVALAEKFRAMGYDIPNEKIINVGAAIGSHVGPNACGMVYVVE
jgi:DegV family protein with EDD domain